MKCTKLSTLLLLSAMGLNFAAKPSLAAILSDFEGGAADYDNAAIQTTGKFRDTSAGGHINISNNGAGNDYLVLAGNGGSSRPSTVYDTTPGNTSPYSLFTTPVGATTTVTVDVEFPPAVSTMFLKLGILDPTASNNRGVVFEFRDQVGATQDQIGLKYLTSSSGEGIGAEGADIQALTSTGSAIVNPVLRMTLNFSNNGASATITGQVNTISALEGTLGSLVASLTPQIINYGTGATELNLSPATTGFEILLGRNVTTSGDVWVDRLTLTVVPEPSSVAMLLIGSVMFGRIGRKRR